MRNLTRLSSVALVLATLWACDNLKPIDHEQEDPLWDPVIDDGETWEPTGDSSDAPGAVDNTPPRASADYSYPDDDDVDLVPGTMVTLDGILSADLDGDRLSYRWYLGHVPADSTSAIVNSSFPQAQLYVDRSGTFEVFLEVSDGYAADTDRVDIEVENANLPPTAHAGPDQTVTVGSVAELDGTESVDPDGDRIEEMHWTFITRPSGSAAVLQGVSIQPAFSPRFSVDKPGNYIIELVAVDQHGLEGAPDRVNILASEPDAPDGSDSCLGCAEMAEQQIRTRWTFHDATQVSVAMLPFFTLWWQRRRDEDPDDERDPRLPPRS